MKRRRGIGAALLLCGSFIAAAAPLLVRDVTVVDVKTGAEASKRSVLIVGDKIAEVGERVKDAPGARVIDGAGKYLIPGLWDMHVHLWYKEHQFPLYLANGITGVRDMGSDFDLVSKWRSEIARGKLLSPRIETSGPPVDGAPSGDAKLPVLVVHTPEEARAAFDKLAGMRVDFVKVLSGTPRDAYIALLDRARKYRTPVAGHVPDSVTVWEAVDARQKSIEHLFGVLLACSSEEEKLRQARQEAVEHKDQAAYSKVQERTLDTFDRAKAEKLFARMAMFGTASAPTLSMLRRMYYLDADALVSNPLLPYVSEAIRKGWEDPRAEKKQIPEPVLTRLSRQYELLAQLVPMMQKAGVTILAGTDTGDPYTYPGDELHRELELLVKAGLTPLQALRAATIEPANYLGVQASLGSIEPGKSADLALLDADPLADIRNTRKIAGVVLSGKYLPASELSAMLAQTKAPQ